jgi:S1-C subfamily serine protease
VTNVHVIRGADRIDVVSSDGRSRTAEVKAKNDRFDLAILTFPQPPPGIEPVPLSGQVLRACRPGEIVLATGNPFFLAGDGASVPSLGVISGKGRWMEGTLLHGETIQHDAAVNPGNSGGPLWAGDGTFLGINETIATHSRSQGSGPCSTGASYSISVHQVRRVLGDLLDPLDERSAAWGRATFAAARDEGGRVTGAEAISTDDAGERRLASVGLVPGDVVTRLTPLSAGTPPAAAKEITTPQQLASILASLRAGSKVRVDYRRGERAGSWFGPLP